MRKLSAVPMLVAGVLLVVSTASAQDRSQVGGFGGFTFGSTTSAATFGGTVRAPLAGGMQIVGEAGRLEDVMPSTRSADARPRLSLQEDPGRRVKASRWYANRRR